MATQFVFGRDIAPLTIDSTNLADACISSAKIVPGAVGTTQLAASAVTASILAANSVSTAAIQALAVTTAAIADLQITPAKLADGAVTSTKLAANAVTSAAILNGSVVLGKLGAASVDATAIATNAVTTAKILDANITGAKILDGAITSAKYAPASIQSSHLSTGDLHFAADTTSLANKKIVFNLQLDGVTLSNGPNADISSALTGEVSVTSAGSSEGVITDTPKNRCTLRDVNFAPILDGSSREIYGRLTFSAGVWTLTYKVDITGTETPVSLTAGPYANAHVMVPKRYNLNVAPEDAFRNAAQFTNNTSALASHITQPTGAHAATAISVVDAGNHFTAANVEDALTAIVGTSWIEGTSDSLNGHLTRATGAHAATAISFAAAGGRVTPLTSTQTNAAIEELHGEVEVLQAAPPSVVFGFKYFLSLNGQTVYNVTGAPNAPFIPSNNSLQVFVDGILQSKDAGHYTEDPTGNFITLTSASAANENVILRWYK